MIFFIFSIFYIYIFIFIFLYFSFSLKEHKINSKILCTIYIPILNSFRFRRAIDTYSVFNWDTVIGFSDFPVQSVVIGANDVNLRAGSARRSVKRIRIKRMRPSKPVGEGTRTVTHGGNRFHKIEGSLPSSPYPRPASSLQCAALWEPAALSTAGEIDDPLDTDRNRT